MVAPLTVVMELVILAPGWGTQSSEATGICLVFSSDESKTKPQNTKVIQSRLAPCRATRSRPTRSSASGILAGSFASRIPPLLAPWTCPSYSGRHITPSSNKSGDGSGVHSWTVPFRQAWAAKCHRERLVDKVKRTFDLIRFVRRSRANSTYELASRIAIIDWPLSVDVDWPARFGLSYQRRRRRWRRWPKVITRNQVSYVRTNTTSDSRARVAPPTCSPLDLLRVRCAGRSEIDRRAACFKHAVLDQGLWRRHRADTWSSMEPGGLPLTSPARRILREMLHEFSNLEFSNPPIVELGISRQVLHHGRISLFGKLQGTPLPVFQSYSIILDTPLIRHVHARELHEYSLSRYCRRLVCTHDTQRVCVCVSLLCSLFLSPLSIRARVELGRSRSSLASLAHRRSAEKHHAQFIRPEDGEQTAVECRRLGRT